MTQLTKLGDVAKYLRAGDLVRPKISACAMQIGKISRAHGAWLAGEFFDHNTQVELVNPRWVPWGQIKCTVDAVAMAHGKVTTWDGFSGILDSSVMILCRETNGHLEPVRAETLPREARGSELRPGDICTVDCARSEWLITKACVSGTYAGRAWHCAGRGVGIILHTDFVTILSRNNPIPSDEQSASAPPYRLATRADVRAGMRVAFQHGKGGDWGEPGIVSRVGPNDLGMNAEVPGGYYGVDGKLARLPVRIYDAPEAQPTPQPDHDRLRREWDYLAERIRWHALVDLAKVRHGADCRAEHLLDQATCAFEQALGSYAKGGGSPGRYGGFLVVINPDNRDRPIELYSEALNGAAYRAKCAELWPVVKTEPERPTGACADCKAPYWPGGATKCEYTRANLCLECVRKSDGPPEVTTAASAPDNLTPAQRYHLEHNLGWSTPGWEA